MARYRVSPGTIRQAVAHLVREGVLDARPGHGTFVVRKPAAPSAAEDFGWQGLALGSSRITADAIQGILGVVPDGAINLAGGYPAEELQAIDLVGRAMSRVSRRPGVWNRMPPEGLEPLREWFARELGAPISAHDVVITSGSQAAITTCFSALAIPGSALLVESPTYVGAMVAARAAGLRLVPVPTDRFGVRPDMLAQAFATSGAKLFYCQPTHANPTGASLSSERRAQVLDVVSAAQAILIEDDWCRDLSFEREPPRPLICSDRNGHCVYLRSITKSTAPGLRIGAIVARGAALSRLTACRMAAEFFVSGPLQETALEILRSPAWWRHLKGVRSALVRRRDALALTFRTRMGEECLPLIPTGGIHLWVRLPDRVDDVEIVSRAAEENVLVSAGTQWFPAEATGSFLRVSYACAPESLLARGAEVLADAVVRASRGSAGRRPSG